MPIFLCLNYYYLSHKKKHKQELEKKLKLSGKYYREGKKKMVTMSYLRSYSPNKQKLEGNTPLVGTCFNLSAVLRHVKRCLAWAGDYKSRNLSLQNWRWFNHHLLKPHLLSRKAMRYLLWLCHKSHSSCKWKQAFFFFPQTLSVAISSYIFFWMNSPKGSCRH